MQAKYITIANFTKSINELNLEFSSTQIKTILASFQEKHKYVILTTREIKKCAKTLKEIANIKLNHAYEILSRSLFSTTWHVSKAKLEREESEYRIKEIFNVYDSSVISNKRFFFSPYLLKSEEKIIKQVYPDFSNISDPLECQKTIKKIYLELIKRKELNLEQTEYDPLFIFISTQSEYGLIQTLFDPVMKEFKELLRTARRYRITINFATSRAVSCEVPEEIVANFTQKQIFRLNRE